jgi:hypothetical protein
MVLVRVGLGMAIRALENRVIAWVCVACCANPIRATVAGVEPGVVEDRTCPPGDDLMAGLARGGKARCDVVGIVGTLILHFVTRIAVGRERSVVVVHVATCTRHCCVSSD